tara:strand:- start:460 stop:747 length:288 start_codon:yes stop_codon:yes gene_type:complete
MKITKRKLRNIVKHTLFESSRAGESHDAGYEDGSHGIDPRYIDDMDYMSGYEMGEEDAEHDAERSKGANAQRKGLAGSSYEKTLADYRSNPEWFN